MGVIPEAFYTQVEKQIDKIGTCEDLQKLTDKLYAQVEAHIKDAVQKLISGNSKKLEPLVAFLNKLKGLVPSLNLNFLKELVDTLELLKNALLASFYPSYFALKSAMELINGVPSEYVKLQSLINRKISEKMCDGLNSPEIIFPPIPDLSAVTNTLDPLMGALDNVFEDALSNLDKQSKEKIKEDTLEQIESSSWTLEQRKEYIKNLLLEERSMAEKSIEESRSKYEKVKTDYEFWHNLMEEYYGFNPPKVPLNSKGKPIDGKARKTIAQYQAADKFYKEYKEKFEAGPELLSWYEDEIKDIDKFLPLLDEVTSWEEYEEWLVSTYNSKIQAYLFDASDYDKV